MEKEDGACLERGEEMTLRLTKKQARELGIMTAPPGNHPAQRMNVLEREYADYLDSLKLLGEIHDWRFEWFRFILYHGLPGEQQEASYKMDFLVIKHVPYLDWFSSYEIKPIIILPVWDKLEVHEIKGYWRSRDRIRFKMAAELNPWFTFYGVTRNRANKQWEYERF